MSVRLNYFSKKDIKQYQSFTTNRSYFTLPSVIFTILTEAPAENRTNKMKVFIVIVVVFLLFDATQQRSHFSRESTESSEEDSSLSEENNFDIDDIQNLDVNEDIELISLLVDKLILNSLRDQRRLLTTERDMKAHHNPMHHVRKHHHKHHHKRNKNSSNSDMIPYPRAG